MPRNAKCPKKVHTACFRVLGLASTGVEGCKRLRHNQAQESEKLAAGSVVVVVGK